MKYLRAVLRADAQNINIELDRSRRPRPVELFWWKRESPVTLQTARRLRVDDVQPTFAEQIPRGDHRSASSHARAWRFWRKGADRDAGSDDDIKS